MMIIKIYFATIIDIYLCLDYWNLGKVKNDEDQILFKKLLTSLLAVSFHFILIKKQRFFNIIEIGERKKLKKMK